jgi:hypothetical protein
MALTLKDNGCKKQLSRIMVTPWKRGYNAGR